MRPPTEPEPLQCDEVAIDCRRWRVKYTTKIPKGEWGYCTHPDNPDRHVAVNSRLGRERMLACHLHELAHAAFWPASEEAVEEFADVAAKYLLRNHVLDRLGLEKKQS